MLGAGACSGAGLIWCGPRGWRTAPDASSPGEHVPVVFPDQSLESALSAFGKCDALPVVNRRDDSDVLGVLTLDAALEAYGIGREKTPEAFRQACTRFIFTENFVSDTGGPAPAKAALRPMSEAISLIDKALEPMEEDAEGWYQLGAVGQRMQNLSPEFDTRTFGHPKLSDLVEATARFELNREGPHVRLRPKPVRRRKR